MLQFNSAVTRQITQDNTGYGQFSILDAIPRILGNINKIAIPVIFALGLSFIPGADAGPMAYAACTTLCLGFATPVMAPLCVSGCLPTLYLPTP